MRIRVLNDYGRRVVASAGGTVLEPYYSTSNGYGHVIVIGHGDGWRTRYAHLSERLVGQERGGRMLKPSWRPPRAGKR